MVAELDAALIDYYRPVLAGDDAQYRKFMRDDLLAFTMGMYGDGQSYQPAAHHELIADHLMALSRRDLRYLLIVMPPRRGKSELASVNFPAWHLGNHPDDEIIGVSYSADLAFEFSGRARNLLKDDRWPFSDIRLDPAAQRVDRWKLAGRRGSYRAAGIGGGVTGMGAHVLIIDDPVKSQADADSATFRDHAWRWFQTDVLTRLAPNAGTVIIGTRWHEDDLIGRALNMAVPWTELWLPAQAEPTPERPDLLGRAAGDYLWPERFSPAEYEETKRRVGERVWLTLYQGQPYSDQGSVFQRAWFGQRYDRLPRLVDVCVSVDSAFKTGVANDYSVFAVWGADGAGRYYLVDLWRDKVEFPELVDAGGDLWRKHRPAYPGLYLLPEDTASATSAIQVWKRHERRPDGVVRPALPVIPVKVGSESKLARAEGITHLFEAGQVHLPADAPWLSAWIEEHVRFPFGSHDDQVDTTSLALARLSRPKPQGANSF